MNKFLFCKFKKKFEEYNPTLNELIIETLMKDLNVDNQSLLNEGYAFFTEEKIIEEPKTKVQIVKDGPALISGKFTLKDVDGNQLANAENVAICRCGESSTMPFCDGTHHKIGFKEKR